MCATRSVSSFEIPEGAQDASGDKRPFKLRLLWAYAQWIALAVVLALAAHHLTIGRLIKSDDKLKASAANLLAEVPPVFGAFGEQLAALTPIVVLALGVTFVFGVIHGIVTRVRWRRKEE